MTLNRDKRQLEHFLLYLLDHKDEVHEEGIRLHNPRRGYFEILVLREFANQASRFESLTKQVHQECWSTSHPAWN